MRFIFGEYLPDLPDLANPGITEAKNVIPSGSTYLQMPSIEVYSNALNERCQGIFSGRDNDGNAYTFAGDDTDLYRLLTTALWDEISSSTGAYSCASDERWQWAQYGERAIAFNLADYPQSYVMGTSTVFGNLTTDLKAKTGAQVRDFLMVGNTWDGTDGNIPHRIRWSAIGDPTDFTVSATNQSDYQDLDASGGKVQKVVGGEYAAAFQESAIYRITYTGSETIFDFDRVEEKRGTPAPGSVIKYGDLIAFLSDDGFYVFDGNNSAPISHNKISRTFYADLNTDYMDRIDSVVDYEKQIIIWSYPSINSGSGECDKLIMYNYAPNSLTKWTWAEISSQALGNVITGGYTLEQLDNVDNNLDTITPSLDSRYWQANNELIGVFNSDNKLATLSGSGMDAILESTELDHKGTRTRISKLRPLIDGAGTVTLQIGTRSRLQDSISWDPEVSIQTSGNAACRATGLYHRVRANITGGFDTAQGVEVVESSIHGKR